jgi:hypothetical protein
MDPAVAEAVIDGLLQVAATEEGKAALQGLIHADGLEPTDDSAYAPVREMVAAFGIDYESCTNETEIGAAAGGTVSQTMQNGLTTTVDIPAGAVTRPVRINFSPLGAPTHVPKGLADAGVAFRMTAAVSGTGESVMTLQAPFTITARYDPHALRGLAQASLRLHYWDGDAWVAEPTSQVNRGGRTVTARPGHFSMWAVLGERRAYLPLVLRESG